MFEITITGDDRGILDISYKGNTKDYITFTGANEDMELIKKWITIIDKADEFYQNDGIFPNAVYINNT